MNCNDWITGFLASDPPRSKSLVVTIFGDAIVPHGGMVWLGSLIELLAPFGVNDRLLRTSVFRLAQEGWLGAQRDGRRSSYAITPPAMARFVHAYRRIYAPLNVHWDGSWTLILNGDGALNAAERSAVRKELLWEGYSVIAPGIMGHPAADGPALDELLKRLGVAGKLFVVQGKAMRQVSGRALSDLVADGWDLSGVAQGYQQFIAQFEPLLAAVRAAEAEGALAPQQAYVVRTLLIHAYRRVQLHDPQLPVELLPTPWPGALAYELTRAIYQAVYAAAEQHIDATLRREDSAAPAAEPAFFDRFGGLA
ncbi:phenylacetic acid degradation operon negative regulatory protein PaaX [Duganella violaceipulchra]|uniref:Phenylacetic acid degradation operon negative regulatory protein n=1 Tax=Duganella violaceipulchra TaxID=2849652 RepID=A0AA41H3H2_9BURK|nr:phenylacetic acid degradation operon negative regulatory protein PaaX [Duganella violaceicalia]MBV6320178.1 phenylacetic acid degradation operon negative regulatory protein PaaX [Duganella violaceicalia]MCP2011626.1 phenylacetic acid degradation operon negative regulatory protein [Duganella violaceicalia]